MAYKHKTDAELAETYKHSEMGGQTAGRPPVAVDWNVFESLCAVQCTHDEIAFTLQISKAALYEKACDHYKELSFPTIYKMFCSPGRVSLRRHQFRQAENNIAMSIWLGKQYLEQHEPWQPTADIRDNPAALARDAQAKRDTGDTGGTGGRCM